jgi:hypothetical protein
MIDIEFPENIKEWYPFSNAIVSTQMDFINLCDSLFDFLFWAFGKHEITYMKMYEAWNKLHPEYLLNESDEIYESLCKMNYIYKNIYLKSVDKVD